MTHTPLEKIRIGTRGSKLALTQVEMVSALLETHHPDLRIEVVKILTSGDWRPEQGETRLDESAGGKGLFAKEIEQALLEGAIDCGVHSMKDMESFLPEGLVIDHMLPREDTRDAFLSNAYKSIEEMPEGAVIGTSSIRRQAFILAKRPDLKVIPLRGNVPTRIEKLRAGQVDGTILALAGLKRLGLADEAASVIDPDFMLPAAGQGAIGIETRAGDKAVRTLFDPLHCRETGLCVKAERAALAALGGSCRTPVGAQARLETGDMLSVKVIVCAPDGTRQHAHNLHRPIENDEDAQALGTEAGAILQKQVPPAWLKP